MDKFKLFFSRISLLNEQQFDELSKYASFAIKLPTNQVGAPIKTTLHITLKKLLPIDLFSILFNNIQETKNKLEVHFIGNPVAIDTQELSKYIQFFLEYKKINNVLVHNLVKRQSLSISDSGLILITYESKSELHEFKLIEKGLLDFLHSINLHTTGFDYEFNHDHKEIEAIKKAKQEQIYASLAPINADETQLRKVTIYNQNLFKNKFKDPITKLSEIVFTGENQYINVTGEIFKVTNDTLKNGNQKFVFYITDYDDSLAITVFVGTRKATNSWGTDSNLPLYYLNSLKKGD
jgi:DNA polymerase III alpha subunit (gram-positive type)